MTKSISLGIGLASPPSGVDMVAIEQFLAANNKNHKTYIMAPAKSGGARAAAFDIMLIVSTAGSIASLASLLWLAYDKFIAPKKSNKNSNAGIYIGIKRSDGSVVDFWIGNKYKNRDIFIEEFKSKVTIVCDQDDPIFWKQQITEIEKSGFWIRLDKGEKK